MSHKGISQGIYLKMKAVSANVCTGLVPLQSLVYECLGPADGDAAH